MRHTPDRPLDPPDECPCGAHTYRSDGMCSDCAREAAAEARADSWDDEREYRSAMRDWDDSRFAPED
jgi:hypothetical protein